jgi:hypothetical protein
MSPAQAHRALAPRPPAQTHAPARLEGDPAAGRLRAGPARGRERGGRRWHVCTGLGAGGGQLIFSRLYGGRMVVLKTPSLLSTGADPAGLDRTTLQRHRGRGRAGGVTYHHVKSPIVNIHILGLAYHHHQYMI